MSEADPASRFERIVAHLVRHKVDFIVVGGQAELAMGSPRMTFDTDITYSRKDDNLQRLAAALGDLSVTLRNAPPDLPFFIDARSLKLGSNFTFESSLGPLDLLGFVEPIGDFDAVAQHAELHTQGSFQIRTISLADLIRVKEYVRRPKDLQSLIHLYAIRERRATGLP